MGSRELVENTGAHVVLNICGGQEFQPAEVTRAGFPPFHPGYTFAEGTVFLEVTLSVKGEAEEIKVLRDLPPFTAEAKAVVGDWRFILATFNGHPVRSNILLAFCVPVGFYQPISVINAWT